jgi:hypothetical protein
MEAREYVKREIDVLPEAVFERVQSFVLFEKYRLNKTGYDWIQPVPVLTDSYKSKTPATQSASPIDAFFSTYGAWEDDRDTETIIADIRNSRVNKEGIVL